MIIRDHRTDEQIYSEIAMNMTESLNERFPECGDGIDFIATEIFKDLLGRTVEELVIDMEGE